MPANKKIWALPKEKLSEEELKVKKEKLNKLLKEREDPNLTKFFKEMEEFKEGHFTRNPRDFFDRKLGHVTYSVIFFVCSIGCTVCQEL